MRGGFNAPDRRNRIKAARASVPVPLQAVRLTWSSHALSVSNLRSGASWQWRHVFRYFAPALAISVAVGPAATPIGPDTAIDTKTDTIDSLVIRLFPVPSVSLVRLAGHVFYRSSSEISYSIPYRLPMAKWKQARSR